MLKDHIVIDQHRETKLYHACLYQNHPTPSGSDRPILKLSTNVGKNTPQEAMDEMQKSLKPEYWDTLDLPILN